MKIPFTQWILTGLVCLPLSMQAVAADNEKLSTEQRLDRLERVMRNQSLADMVYQLQQLQQEVQRLQGELELQKHAMDAMNKRQRDLYLDIDQRLSRMQPGNGVPMAPPPSASMAAPPPAASPPAMPASAPPAANTAVAPSTPVDPKKESEAYQSAFNLLKQGRYPDSIKAFRTFLANYPGGSYADNAQYWLAEASYVNRDFDTALGDFGKVLSDYPHSAKVPGAMLKMGYIYYEQQDWTKARDVLHNLQNDFAGSTEGRLAEKRLQRMDKEGR
jgi:tol-pal system protein YbgF